MFLFFFHVFFPMCVCVFFFSCFSSGFQRFLMFSVFFLFCFVFLFFFFFFYGLTILRPLNVFFGGLIQVQVKLEHLLLGQK